MSSKRFLGRAKLIFSIGLVALTMLIIVDNRSMYALGLELKSGESGICIDQEQLFNLSNMYPGQPPADSKRQLKVSNVDELDFQCDISSDLMDMKEGTLFEVLKLYIRDEKGKLLFAGKLKDLKNVVLGTIKAGSSKIYDFALELPSDVDNTYQHQSASFNFIVKTYDSADDNTNGNVSVDRDTLTADDSTILGYKNLQKYDQLGINAQWEVA